LIAAVLSGCATPLQKAIIRGDDEAVRRIIGAGADVEGLGWGTDKQESPLYTAAVTDNLRAAQLLVAKGAKVDRILSYGRHPLKQAAFWGYTDMVSFLLGAGADPEAGGPETALVLAACVPGNRVSNPIDKGIMKLLLEKGADPNRSGNLIVRIGDTPLACAARKGDAAAVRLLLKHGAEVDPAALDQAAGPVKRLLEEALAAADAVIFGTERGLVDRLRQRFPHKTFVPLSGAAVCGNMKLNTLAKLAWSLDHRRHEVVLPEDVRVRAERSLRAMLELSGGWTAPSGEEEVLELAGVRPSGCGCA